MNFILLISRHFIFSARFLAKDSILGTSEFRISSKILIEISHTEGISELLVQ
jgi:hypothetical protein